MPCLIGEKYDVHVYLQSRADAHAMEIPPSAYSKLPHPQSDDWREPWNPPRRFVNTKDPGYERAPANEVTLVHSETSVPCTGSADARITSMPHGSSVAALVGGWRKLNPGELVLPNLTELTHPRDNFFWETGNLHIASVCFG